MYQQQLKCLHVMCFCAYLLSARKQRAESGSGMRQAQARTKEEHTAVRPQFQGSVSKAQKLICTKSQTTRSRVIILCSCVAKRMVAPEQREAYSNEHAITDFNSADAKRNTQSVSVASRVYYLAGIGKCTNPLEPFCAALRWHQFVLHSRSPASCITCDRCGVITLPRTRL